MDNIINCCICQKPLAQVINYRRVESEEDGYRNYAAFCFPNCFLKYKRGCPYISFCEYVGKRSRSEGDEKRSNKRQRID